MSRPDEAARRAYWTEQLELGYELIQQVLQFPFRECGEGFASLREAVASSGIEMQFSDSKIAGQLDRVYFMRESLVRDVITIGQEMNARGWILKIEDCYRSLEMQGQLVRKPELFDIILQRCIWENNGELPAVELVSRRAAVLVANIPKFGTHMSGSAIDISVLRRTDGSEVWRGNPYLEMSERTPMRSPFVEPEALQNRLDITALLEQHGFMHYVFEFWHYNKDDALGHIETGRSAPARFGPVHWDPQTNRVTTVDNPHELLNPLPVIEREIAAALERARATAGPK